MKNVVLVLDRDVNPVDFCSGSPKVYIYIFIFLKLGLSCAKIMSSISELCLFKVCAQLSCALFALCLFAYTKSCKGDSNYIRGKVLWEGITTAFEAYCFFHCF